MKNSGIEWIGDIPDNWKSIPMRALFAENNNKNIFGQETKALQFKFGEIVSKQNFDASDDQYVADTILKYNIVDKGMLVINGLNLNFDFVTKRVGLVKERGVITSAYMSFAVKKLNIVLPEYAAYLLKSYDNCTAFHNMGGGVRKILNFDELKRNLFVLPPIEEQERIAGFLDKKCGEIDGLIADIKTQVQTLEQYKRSVITEAVTKGLNPSAEMKESGVDYIGIMPIEWRLLKLKYILSEINIRSKTGEEDLLSVSQYRGVILATENRMRTMQAESLIGYKLVQINDLVFNKLNPSLARFGCSAYNGITSPDFAVYRPNNFAITKYLEYLLKTDKYAMQYARMAGGVGDGFSRLYTNQLYEIKVALPKLSEQKEIVDYLDNKCAQIDELISAKQSQIETLESYKKSLIYEYVTGKKEVV